MAASRSDCLSEVFFESRGALGMTGLAVGMDGTVGIIKNIITRSKDKGILRLTGFHSTTVHSINQ